LTAKELDPQTQELLNQMAQKVVPPLNTLTPTEARELKNAVFLELGGPPEPVSSVASMNVPGPAGNLPIRVYTPEGNPPFPVLVYFHGGGWVIGNLDTHDSLCRSFANGTPCVVVSVDYRLAPEHKFPAAVEDSYAATLWVAQNADRLNADPARIAVAGDSAGGDLAAVVSLMARDKGGPSIAYQVLIYPVTDLSSFETQSYREHAESYILTKASMEYYRGHYLRSEQDSYHPYASPLLAPDLSGLPPAFVVTAEFDVLADEAEAYAKRLEQAGVPVTYRCYKGMIHPFLSFSGVLDRARDAMAEVTAQLRSAFAK
jgi:acetyl esterase